jgi:hypothetical protein
VTAAAGSSGLAARGGRSCSCPILSPRSIAVTGIRADSVSVERLGVVYAQHAPSGPRSGVDCLPSPLWPQHPHLLRPFRPSPARITAAACGSRGPPPNATAKVSIERAAAAGGRQHGH